MALFFLSWIGIGLSGGRVNLNRLPGKVFPCITVNVTLSTRYLQAGTRIHMVTMVMMGGSLTQYPQESNTDQHSLLTMSWAVASTWWTGLSSSQKMGPTLVSMCVLCTHSVGDHIPCVPPHTHTHTSGTAVSDVPVSNG